MTSLLGVSPEQLIEHAREAAGLIRVCEAKLRKGWPKDKSQPGYLISRKWFTQWAEYTGYFDIFRDLEPTSDTFGVTPPNPRINADIVVSSGASNSTSTSFLEFNVDKIEENNAYLNVILNPTVDAAAVKVVDGPTWNFFKAVYPDAIDIQRPVIVTPQNRIVTDILLLQPEVIVIDSETIKRIRSLSDAQIKGNNAATNQLSVRRVQLPSYATIEELESLFAQQFGSKRVKVWRYSTCVQKSDMHSEIIQSIRSKNKEDSLKIQGIHLGNPSSFIGESLKNIVLRDILKNHYTILVEVDDGFSFGASRISLKDRIQNNSGKAAKFIGVCEFCTKPLELKVQCMCKSVAYCSASCKYRDQDFHSRSCDVAADSDSDSEMEFLPIEISGRSGLKNIGNTCYLAAVLQNLYASKEFSEEFTMNKVVKHPKSTAKLFQKFGKLFKEMAMFQEDSVEPWSFKTQFAKLNPEFGGNFQHDAGEFLTCLLDSLNEQSQKTPNNNNNNQAKNSSKQAPQIACETFWNEIVKPNYSDSISRSFLGLFESCVTCPTCTSSSSSFDPFTILSLPIKQKPVERQILVNFYKANLKYEITPLRMTYTTQETRLLDLVVSACKQVEVEYLDNIAVYTLEGERVTSTHFKSLEGFVEDLEIFLEGKNRSLVFYELPAPGNKLSSDEVKQDQEAIDAISESAGTAATWTRASTFDEKQHRLVQIGFARVVKTSMAGMMTIDEKRPFSISMVQSISKSNTLSEIYLAIAQRLAEFHPTSLALLQSVYAPKSPVKEQPVVVADSTVIVENPTTQAASKTSTTVPIPTPTNQNSKKVEEPIKIQAPQPSFPEVAASSSGWDSIPTIAPQAPSKKQGSSASNPTQQQAKSTNTANNKSTQNATNTTTTTTTSSTAASTISTDSKASTPLQKAPSNNSNPTPQPQQQQQAQSVSDWDFEIPVVKKKLVLKPSTNSSSSSVKSTSTETTASTENPNDKSKISQQSEQPPSTPSDGFKQVQTDGKNNQSNQSNPITNTQKGSQQQQQSQQNAKNPQVYQQKKQQSTQPQSQQNQNPTKPVAAGTPSTTSSTASTASTNAANQKSSAPAAATSTTATVPAGKNTGQSQPVPTSQKVVAEVPSEEDFSELLSQLEFSICIKSKKRRIGGAFKCYFCGKQNCMNCVLPFSNERTLSDFLNTYRDTFELEVFWSKQQHQPNKQIQKSLIDSNQASQQAKKLNLPSLSYCLESFVSEETLSLENQWFCVTCETYRQAQKRLAIKYAPNNLIVQIKRFKTNSKDGSREKNSQQVLFPETGLTLKIDDVIQASPDRPEHNKKLEGSLDYDLYGVILHEGTAEQGHYIAICKHNNTWIMFDDDRISTIDADKVAGHKNAYLLFYRAKQQL